jgi:phage-related protein
MALSPLVFQQGGAPDSAKPLKHFGPLVYEMTEDQRGDAFRAYRIARADDVAQAPHAFGEEVLVRHRLGRPRSWQRSG